MCQRALVFTAEAKSQAIPNHRHDIVAAVVSWLQPVVVMTPHSWQLQLFRGAEKAAMPQMLLFLRAAHFMLAYRGVVWRTVENGLSLARSCQQHFHATVL